MPLKPAVVEDVSAATAAYVWNALPDIAALPAPEGFRRLKEIVETAFAAYADATGGWGVPPPSRN